MPIFDQRPIDAPVLLWTLFIAVSSAILSAIVALVVLVQLPADAFLDSGSREPKSLRRLALRVGANLAGWALILVGVVLSIPGVPGQGVLTILVGLLLVDFPGRKRLLRKLLARPALRRSVDRIRARFGRPPFAE